MLLSRLREHFHEARAELFLRLLRPRSGDRLLDLGGSDGKLSARITRSVPLNVTVADVDAWHAPEVEARGFRHVVLPETGPLPFADGEFDLVLCNSVIEHVTLPKARCSTAARVPAHEWKRAAAAAQAAFAAEIRRVGRAYFVQTPHRYFPIDPHVVLPFTHWLSHDNACRLVRLSDRWWIKSCDDIVDWELLTPTQMARLFPDGGIHIERLLGLPKSIVAFQAAH